MFYFNIYNIYLTVTTNLEQQKNLEKNLQQQLYSYNRLTYK